MWNEGAVGEGRPSLPLPPHSGRFFTDHSETVSSCLGEQDISVIRPEVPYTLG